MINILLLIVVGVIIGCAVLGLIGLWLDRKQATLAVLSALSNWMERVSTALYDLQDTLRFKWFQCSDGKGCMGCEWDVRIARLDLLYALVGRPYFGGEEDGPEHTSLAFPHQVRGGNDMKKR